MFNSSFYIIFAFGPGFITRISQCVSTAIQEFSLKPSIWEPIDLLNNAIHPLSASCILTLNSPMIKKGTYARLILADMD